MDKYVTVSVFRTRLISLYNELYRAEVKGDTDLDAAYEELNEVLTRYGMPELVGKLKFEEDEEEYDNAS